MQYDASSPSEYIESLDADWRKEKLLELRQLIPQQDADIQETISKTKDIAKTRTNEFITQAISMLAEGKDISC